MSIIIKLYIFTFKMCHILTVNIYCNHPSTPSLGLYLRALDQIPTGGPVQHCAQFTRLNSLKHRVRRHDDKHHTRPEFEPRRV